MDFKNIRIGKKKLKDMSLIVVQAEIFLTNNIKVECPTL